MRRFSVDEVTPASRPLPVHPIRQDTPDALVIGGDPDALVIDHGPTHALLGAVSLAFAQHRPLVLSPDAVWLTIAQGVAQHVRLHAEQLRGRLVRHNGIKRLVVPVSGVPTDATGWATFVDALRGCLANDIGDGPARLLECDFSTTSDVDRIASQIVLLDAYAPYYSFWMTAICGIPQITLLGTVDDWRTIRARIDVIAELELATWCRSLASICDQFVRAAAGDVELAFWKRIYNPQDAYGGEQITGWITRLYPYLESAGQVDFPNPMLELPIDEPKQRTSKDQPDYHGPGLFTSQVRASRSRVLIRIGDRQLAQQDAMALIAGVVAVTQDSDGGLRPITGWHIEHASPPLGDLLDKLLAHHQPAPLTGQEIGEGTDELIELSHRVGSAGAVVFDGPRAWRLLPPGERYAHMKEDGGFALLRVAELPDELSLCLARHYDGSVAWLVCRVSPPKRRSSGGIGMAEVRDSPAQIRVLGASLATILTTALATGGELTGLDTGRFDELLRIDR